MAVQLFHQPLNSIHNRKWEVIDYDNDDTLAGTLTGANNAEGEPDPLGLGATIECVACISVAWFRVY